MDTAVKPENGSKVATQVNGVESLRASISKHLIYKILKIIYVIINSGISQTKTVTVS